MGGIPNNPFFNSRLVTSCGDLIIKTQLFSPIPKVLEKMKIGDVLEIVLLDLNGPCVAVHNKEIAGTIVSKDLLLLIQCINKGQDFIAIVRSILGGSCAITIKSN